MGIITGYADDSSVTDNDKALGVDSSGSTVLLPMTGINKYLGPGWTIASDSLSYSSWNSTTKVGILNANSGATTRYSVGMWLKFSQTTLGVKYARITGLATSAVTAKFYGGTQLDNEAITNPFYSGDQTPLGVPASNISSSLIDYGGGGSGIWWEEIGRTTLTTTNSNISVTGLPSRKYLKIMCTFVLSTGGGYNLTFNNDSAANYAYRVSTNSANASGGSSTALFLDSGAGGITTSIVDIINISGQEKIVNSLSMSSGGAGAASIPSQRYGAGKWANTSTQINRIDVLNSSGLHAADTELVVLGHN